jgi:hypothetical protein
MDRIARFKELADYDRAISTSILGDLACRHSRLFASSTVITPSLPTVHRFGEHLADLAIAICRNHGDLRDLVIG